MRPEPLKLFVCGDVMLGRGIDQVLPHPGDPSLRERYVRDARTYVELAEQVNGPVPRPVDPAWPWGEALGLLDDAGVDVRIVNLETSVTTSDEFAPGKAVHYRMHPDNLPALLAARPDVCVLANNHVLDHGMAGLEETLAAVAGAGPLVAGAGHDEDAATRPAVVPLEGGGRVLVLAVAMATSGVPAEWAATPHRPGVAYLDGPSAEAAAAVADRIRHHRNPGDVAVVSVHWGPNWGYRVTSDEQRFAHALVDAGADVVHGHSSHHPRPVEVYRGKLIVYGCGDLIDDYEGIRGSERYRPDLRLLYLATLERGSGELSRLVMPVLQARRLRLEHASEDDADWLAEELGRHDQGFAVGIRRENGAVLVAEWGG